MRCTTKTLILRSLFLSLSLNVLPSANARTCSNATGAGRWGFTVTGSVILPTGAAAPVAQVGSYTADREGNLEGTQTRSLGGSVASETFTGTTATSADCTGKATIYVYDKTTGNLVRTSTLDYIYDADGRQARAIVTSIVLPNGASLAPVLTLDYRRISSGVND